KSKSSHRTLNLLPREKGVEFNGKNAKAFWTYFHSSFYLNSSLTDAEKYRRLLSGVQGDKEAASLVSGFEPDGSQLEECIERFRDRYLDARQMKLESLQMARELPDLKHMYDRDRKSVV